MAMASLWANTAVAWRGSARAASISRLPSANTGRLAGGTDQDSSPSPAAAAAKLSWRSLNGCMSTGPGSWTTRRWPSSARCPAASLAPPRSSWVTAGIPEPGRLRTASTTGTREVQSTTRARSPQRTARTTSPSTCRARRWPTARSSAWESSARLGHQGHVVGPLQTVLEPAQDRRGVGVAEVGDHHADGRAEPTAQPLAIMWWR